MSYRDPYAGRYQQNYSDGPEFDPYYANQPNTTYNRGPGGYDPYANAGGYQDEPVPAVTSPPRNNVKETSTFDAEDAPSPSRRGSR